MELSRVEFLIAAAVVAACRAANSADSGTSSENQLDPESVKRITEEVCRQTSLWQRESLVRMCPVA